MGQTVVEKVVEKIAQAHRAEGPGEQPLRCGDFLDIRPRHVLIHRAGSGIGHQVMVEQGYVLPGSFVVSSDSHANMYGAFGALGTPFVRTDAATIWAAGTFWWQIPPTVSVILEGELPPGAMGKAIVNSRYEDLAAAARVLRGRKVARAVLSRSNATLELDGLFDEQLQSLIAYLGSDSRYDFSGYELPTLVRRVAPPLPRTTPAEAPCIRAVIAHAVPTPGPAPPSCPPLEDGGWGRAPAREDATDRRRSPSTVRSRGHAAVRVDLARLGRRAAASETGTAPAFTTWRRRLLATMSTSGEAVLP